MTDKEKQLLLQDLMYIDPDAEIKDYIAALRVKRCYDKETALISFKDKARRREQEARRKTNKEQNFKYE